MRASCRALSLDALSAQIVGWAFSTDFEGPARGDTVDMTLATGKPESVIISVCGEAKRHSCYPGVYQIGEVYARSVIFMGVRGSGVVPNRFAS
jgi:hypothetical protein